jgi:hypothetical protein
MEGDLLVSVDPGQPLIAAGHDVARIIPDG